MLDAPRLRLFREIVRGGSLRAAADALGYTPSAVSQQLVALERETGTTLVVRGPRGVLLTDAGRSLSHHVDAILARLGDAQAELDEIAGMRAGSLRVAAFPTANAALLPDAVAKFRELYPGISLTLLELMPDQALTLLQHGDVDVAIAFEHGRTPRRPDLVRTVLTEDPMLVALPAGHPLSRRKTVPLVALADEAWIHGDENCPCYPIVMDACEQAGFRPAATFTSNDYSAIQSFVAAGVGVGLIPSLALTGERAGVAIRPLKAPGASRRIVAFTLGRRHRSAAARALVGLLEPTQRPRAPQTGSSET